MRDKHPLAGKAVTLPADMKATSAEGKTYFIEDWWVNVAGQSWMNATGNPACLGYAMRSAAAGLPLDDEVVYGKVNGLGYLVHVSELGGAA